MNQKQLHMQPVSSRYLEQYNALLRYVFQVTDPGTQLRGLAGEGIHPRQVPHHGKGRRDRAGFDRDTLVSQVAVYPMRRAFLAEPTPWAA